MAGRKPTIGELEDELKRRDERIEELRQEIDEQRDLIQRMEENVDDAANVIDLWKEAFDMVESESGVDLGAVLGRAQALVDDYNDLVRQLE